MSLLEGFEEDRGFPGRGFAERDDADFMAVLRMSNGNGNSGQQSERYEPDLSVGESVVFEGERWPLKNSNGVGEVQSVFDAISPALCRVVFKSVCA